MLPATSEFKQKGSFLSRRAWFSVFLVFSLSLVALNYGKNLLVHRSAFENLTLLRSSHQSVVGTFQANFYFFYKEKFLPDIKKVLENNRNIGGLQILAANGLILFDSTSSVHLAAKEPVQTGVQAGTEIVRRLSESSPSFFSKGFSLQVLIPSGQYAVLYKVESRAIRNFLVSGILFTLGLIGFLIFASRSPMIKQFPVTIIGFTKKRMSGLQAKFLLTIIVINLITGAIVFFTLSALQSKEQSARLEKESVLFSKFSTSQIVSDFSNYYYFYYADRFLPVIKNIIASNENIVGIKLISARNGSVLFDSETALTSADSQPIVETTKAGFSSDIETELKTRDLVSRRIRRNSEELVSVINTYRNENQEVLFYVEYLFSFESLKSVISSIRRQILIDLIPSLALGLLIAFLFARFLITPLKRMMQALTQIASGNYDVKIDISRTDEVGELVLAFNNMAGELKKKNELRKYLSDSTYRQIMEAPELSGEPRVNCSRVFATVLFTDIRNFVSHCESLDAEEVASMLNEYFSEMVEVVYKHGGEVDKFIGDAILAVFYAGQEWQAIKPTDLATAPSASETALQALYCALEMRERLRDFNEKRVNQGKRAIEIGVGITYGEVISGPIGAKDRLDFTVIGDAVNVASRIEKISKQGRHTRIVFTNNIEERVKELVECEVLQEEPIPGKEEKVTVYELVQIKSLEQLIKNVRSSDVELKRKSVEVLGQSNNKQALRILVDCLKDEDERTRLLAVLALGRLSDAGDEAVISPMLVALNNEKSTKVMSALISSLGKICTDERILTIVEFLESDNDRIVANTVEALGQVRTDKCLDYILPKLSSKNNRVKANAAMALFAAGHTEVVVSLKPMLMHSDSGMRCSAAFAIGELTLLVQKDKIMERWKNQDPSVKLFLAELQECVPMLVALLKDKDTVVKRQAVIALGKIKDKSAVLPIIDSIDFENDSKELIKDIANSLRAIGSHKVIRDVLAKLT